MNSDPCRRRAWADFAMPANIAPGATVVLPPVTVPSVPFLDDSAEPADWRKVTLMFAGQEVAGLGSTAADWALAVTISFQPTRTGPAGSFVVPAGVLATTSNTLCFVFDQIALPGMSMSVSATLNAAAPANSRCTFSYGALVAPSATRPEPSGAIDL